MQRALNRLCHSKYAATFECMAAWVKAEKAAGQLMIRCLNRICNAYTAGGFGQWVAVLRDLRRVEAETLMAEEHSSTLSKLRAEAETRAEATMRKQ